MRKILSPFMFLLLVFGLCLSPQGKAARLHETPLPTIVLAMPEITAPDGVLGNSFYVSTAGNDTSGDGSLANPFRTIGYVAC